MWLVSEEKLIAQKRYLKSVELREGVSVTLYFPNDV